jgi:hypothetical protein
MRFLTPYPLAAALCTAWAGLTLAGGDRDDPGQRPRFQKLGVLADRRIEESSGLACSYANPGAFWTHNDRGGSPRLFLFGQDGTTLATVRLRGASAVDWEDIASFRRAGRGYVLIGDVGDNDHERSATHKPCTLYVIKEPRVDGFTAQSARAVERVPTEATVSFTYEDGPHNCESVAVDATNETVYLASKEKRRTPCHVYELSLPTNGVKALAVARRIARLQIRTVVAMDISPDGHRAVVLSKKGHKAFEFVRRDGQSWTAAFGNPPQEIPLPERRQGETICYGHDSKTLYLTSEGRKEPIWEVLR